MIISANKRYRVLFLLIFLLQTFFINRPVLAGRTGQRPATTNEYTERPLFIEAYPLEIAGISFMALLLFLYILKQRKHRKELRKIRAELSIALDAGFMAVWRYNVKNDTFKTVHRSTIPSNGMTVAEMGKQIHPKDLEKYKDFIRTLRSGQEEQKNGIFRLYTDKGEQWYEVYAIGLKDKYGKVSHIIGTEHNITDMMEQKNMYEKNKQMLDFIFEAVNIMPWEYDVETQTFSVNNVFVERHNYPGNSIRIDKLMQYSHPSDKHLLSEGIESMVKGTSNLMIIQMRTKAPNRDEYRWFEMQGVVYRRNEEGEVIKIIGLKHDITELKHTEELIRLREKAEESNRLKSAFLANMSHEIRTPLNAIVGFSSLMTETENKEDLRAFNKIIQTNNEMLLRLINDILDMSRIEAGQLDFKFSDVDLNELVQNLEKTFRFKIKQEVLIALELPQETYFLHTEKNRLTQVLSNFISNACKYTSEGTITIGYEVEGKQVYFFVRDTGKGIAKENLPHVFERFAKFDAFVQGTGLGLSICELIVQNLGGEIGVESELGKGSTFWCTLPIVHPKQEKTQRNAI